jgi:hypothetical protein
MAQLPLLAELSLALACYLPLCLIARTFFPKLFQVQIKFIVNVVLYSVYKIQDAFCIYEKMI